jgi:hypothetical protein
LKPFGTFVLKTAALLSACGGPILIHGELKAAMGSKLAFAVIFAPIVAIIFGAFSLKDVQSEPASRFDVVAIYSGLAGVCVLMAMDAYGAFRLVFVEPERADAGLIVVGIAVGIVAAVLYVRRVRAFVRERKSAG